MRVRLSDVESHVEELLLSMQPGQSVLSASAYDTAWVALLSKRFPRHGFEQALDWIRSHQQDNGSWGSSALHYHDRIINTLMCLIALRYAGSKADNHHIHRGEAFIQRYYRAIRHDADETTGFSILSHRLLSFARNLRLHLPDEMYTRSDRFELKFQYLMHHPGLIFQSQALFSLEAFLPDVYSIHPDVPFVASDGSVDGSPAATAANLFFSESPDRRSLSYLQNLLTSRGDGSVPVMEMELAELSLALDVLLDSGTVSIHNARVQDLIDYLADHWQTGIGTSPAQHLPDLNNSAVVFRLMRAAGYDLDPGCFERYESDTAFASYPGESKLSPLANLRLLAALPYIQNHTCKVRWQHKIKQMLHQAQQNHPTIWTDKQHISPYHLLRKAVQTLTDDTLSDAFAERIQWILDTQHPDGGWGCDGSTQEETADVLLTLLYWHSHIEEVNESILNAGADYLYRHFENDDYESLWISKVLYTPHVTVRATILSALHRYERYREQDYHAG